MLAFLLNPKTTEGTLRPIYLKKCNVIFHKGQIIHKNEAITNELYRNLTALISMFD